MDNNKETKNQDTVSTDSEKTVKVDETIAKERSEAFSWVRDVLIMLPIMILVVIVLKTFVFGTYEIPSGSMIDTIEIGDRVIAEKISYTQRGPEPEEIITFEDPVDPGRTLIKRVIATEGQTVNMSIDGKVVVDGIELDEPYTDGQKSYPLADTAVNIEYPYVVPDGYIWVMGDNRNASADSRYFGAVPVSSVSGHAVFTYWPFTRFGTLE